MTVANGSTKVALVTGGSRGIGRAIVEDFVRRGFEVHFTYVKDEAAATSLVEKAKSSGGVAIATRVDARDVSACTAMVEGLLAERRRLDVLVNNAGIIADRLLAMMTVDDWQGVLGTSLNGLFGMTQPAAKQMMQQHGGRIINLTSVSGVVGIPGQTAYSAAKSAIIGFTRSLSKELARYGVCVNAVAPGFIDTDMLSALSPKQRAASIERVPMRRFGTSEEVAGLVGYLATDAPQYLTGQALVVDGGLT
jgi:3-oxoacyl-[acyl-carrier protein] reductase